MYNSWRNHAILDDIDTKSSARCFQGHNLHSSSNGLRTRFWLYPFSLQVVFLLTQFKGDNLFTKFMRLKIWYWFIVLAEELKTIVPGLLIEKQYLVLGMRARVFACLRDFHAQFRMRSTIRAIILSFQIIFSFIQQGCL